MPSVHPACLPVEELLADCVVRRERRSGPGGQHRNKVATAAVIVHTPTGLAAEASERREAAENLRVAVDRLRLRLAIELRSCVGESPLQPAAPGAEAIPPPSPLWRSRCRGGRIVVSDAHADFPALLAEALDVLVPAGYDLGRAAAHLGVTATQLTRFIQRVPEAWSRVSAERARLGLPPRK